MDYPLNVKRGQGNANAQVHIEAAYNGTHAREALDQLDSAYREARAKILGTLQAPQRDTRTY